MSVLDELRQQAEQAKAVEELQPESASVSARQAHLERRLLPRLKALYDYFSEFRSHLSAVAHDVEVEFQLEGLGQLEKLRPGGYELETENPDVVHSFAFHFVYESQRSYEFKVKGQYAAARKQEYLTSHKLRYRTRPGRDMTTFVVDAMVPVRYEFELDSEREAVRLTISNAGDLGSLRYTLEPNALTGQLMDELAKHVLSKPNRFDELTGNVLSETGRFRIRDLVEQEKARLEEGSSAASLASKFRRTLFGSKGQKAGDGGQKEG